MKKENMLEYLERQLEKSLSDYDFAIDWDTKNHLVEIIVVLYANNDATVTLEDLNGVETEEDIIEFEDSLLLYPQGKTLSEADEYLVALPYAGKKGLSKAEAEAIASELKAVLDQGTTALNQFLADETISTFELVWNQARYQEVLKTREAMKHGSERVLYPRY